MTWTQSQRQVFASVRGVTWGNLVPPFRFVALFFACARDDCALSEYPKSADCFDDILEKRHLFWAGSPRKMAKPAHSQIGGFGGVRGVTWSHRFSLWRFFFACAREDCALSEYPKSADCFNDILEKRHRFWAGSPRKMAKPAHSQIGGFGGVGGGTWSRRFSLWRFFLHVHGKTVHFLNIQEV